MRAVLCREYGTPDSLAVGLIERPTVGPEEVRIKVWSAGVNFPDTLIIKGEYQLKPPMPFAPGFEVAGEIVETGSEVAGFRAGDRVMALTSSGYGAFAEEAVALAAELVRIPDSFDYPTAMALLTAYGTSCHALVQRAALKQGETLVVLGATGGVGLAAVELGKALGARVIAVGRSEAKLQLALQKGADAAVSYLDEDFRKQILALTDGKGADVCLDTLGGDPFMAMTRLMNWEGRLLIVGFTTGTIPQIPANLPLLKGYQIVGVYWNPFIKRNAAANTENFRQLFKWHDEGKLQPRIAGIFDLASVPDALNQLLGRHVAGKLIINLIAQ